MATINGYVEAIDTAFMGDVRDRLEADYGEPVESVVVLSWFQFRNTTQGEAPWLAAETAPVDDQGRFSLDVLSPPPADGLWDVFEVERASQTGLQDGRVGLGVLSFGLTVGPFDWGTARDEAPRSVALGQEPAALVVYWAGPEPFVTLEDDFGDLVVPRGISRFEPLKPGPFGPQFLERGLDDAVIFAGGSEPAWEFCRPTTPTETVFSDDLEALPEPGTVDCEFEDPASYVTRCPRVFDVLCEPCEPVRVIAASFDGWPCAPDGRSCDTEHAEFCGLDEALYRCAQSEWRQVGCCGGECD